MAASLLGAIVFLLSFASVGRAAEPFGVERFESSPAADSSGTPATVAGSHPFSLTTSIVLNHSGEGLEQFISGGNPKNVQVDLPAGLIVDPQATPVRCTEAGLVAITSVADDPGNTCPDAAVVGLATVFIRSFGETHAPIYNMVPPPGVPAMLAFNVVGLGFVVNLPGNVRTGGDYGLSATARSVSQEADAYSFKVTLWGDPSDPAHDKERGLCVGTPGENKVFEEEAELEQEITEHGEPNPHRVYFCHVARNSTPFLTMPGSCDGPLQTSLRLDTWQEPVSWLERSVVSPGLVGCDELDFSPSIALQPTTTRPEAPSGLDVTLRLPQHESVDGLAEADLRSAAVTLPAGMTISPSAATGLGSCTPGQIALSSGTSAACPDDSEVGSAEVLSPLLPEPLKGAVYLAAQDNNPFGSLVALYLVVEGQGVVIKLAGQVSLDPGSGQITTTFANNPQLPFSELKLNFFAGPRAALVTPRSCGAYAANSALTPWSATTPVSLASTFSIAAPGGCGAAFAPTLTAGPVTNAAGAFNDFVLTFSRRDGEQHLSGAQITLPRGFAAELPGVAQCSDAQAQAGACGPASLIGAATVAAGPGPSPFWDGLGRVYLTGPYKGAPFGLAIVVPAIAGPFNLGNVVTRARISVDPVTAQITVTADPLPQMINSVEGRQSGIPTDLRTVSVAINRPHFMFNPTSCEQRSLVGVLSSSEGAAAAVSTPTHAVNCSSLAFKPGFSASTQAKTSKANGASLHVRLVLPHAGPQSTGSASSASGSGSSGSSAGSSTGAEEANIARVKVDLPRILPSRLTTLQKACTAAQFDSNPAGCPAASIVGRAKAITPILPVPLEGPAYFVSHGNEAFPQLILVLQGYGVTIDLVGNTFISKSGVTSSTFAHVPDAPVSSFELTLPEGKFSALTANGSVCKSRGKLAMPTEFIAQNGAQIHRSTPISVTGCPRAHNKARHRAKKKAHKRRH